MKIDELILKIADELEEERRIGRLKRGTEDIVDDVRPNIIHFFEKNGRKSIQY